MKKPIILGSIIALLGTSAVFANTNVFMNGEYLEFKDAKPIIRNERTTVPVSAIAKNLGIDYTWNNDTKTVTFNQDEKELDLKIGEENSFVENGRTYVPLKFIAEYFDQDVDWRADSKTVVIGDNAKDIEVPEIDSLKKIEVANLWGQGKVLIKSADSNLPVSIDNTTVLQLEKKGNSIFVTQDSNTRLLLYFDETVWCGPVMDVTDNLNITHKKNKDGTYTAEYKIPADKIDYKEISKIGFRAFDYDTMYFIDKKEVKGK